MSIGVIFLLLKLVIILLKNKKKVKLIEATYKIYEDNVEKYKFCVVMDNPKAV